MQTLTSGCGLGLESAFLLRSRVTQKCAGQLCDSWGPVLSDNAGPLVQKQEKSWFVFLHLLGPVPVFLVGCFSMSSSLQTGLETLEETGDPPRAPACRSHGQAPAGRRGSSSGGGGCWGVGGGPRTAGRQLSQASSPCHVVHCPLRCHSQNTDANYKEFY